MARLFRFYEKKRGDRRTGSKRMGSLGEALFFGFIFAIGLTGFLVMLITLVIPEWHANRHFLETTCKVLETQISEVHDHEGKTEVTLYRPLIKIRYQVKGETFEATTYDVTETTYRDKAKAEAVLAQFTPGEEHACWFNPYQPDQAVVVRGYSGWSYVLLIVPLSFMAIGGGGLIYTLFHWNTSVERRAALSRRASRLDLFEAGGGGNAFPNVPADANLTNSPGTRLAYRLPTATAPGWTLFAALLACVAWNGIVLLFVILAVRQHLKGEPDWMLTISIIPFGLGGIGLVYYLIRQLLITTGVGPTRIEISHHPLHPGQEYDVLVTQEGRLSINVLQMLLVCEEKATYRQGTDTRTETRRVFQERIFARESFEIHPSMPFEHPCRLCVPAACMHSFKADHNEINWMLLVRGDVAGWPDYERVFPVVVYPAPLGVMPDEFLARHAGARR